MITQTYALKTARKLMDEHDLKDWTISFHPRDVSFVARCSYNEQKITFNAPYLSKLNDKEFRHVVLHEIAHELDRRWYGNRGHGETFRKTCAKIGCIFDGTNIFTVNEDSKINALVLFGANKAMLKREIDGDIACPFPNMRVVPKALWQDYDAGRIDFQEFKEIAFDS